MSADQSRREQLSSFTSCDCSDALLKLKVPQGGFIAGPTMWSPRRQEGDTKVVGPVYTVRYALNEDPAPKVASHYIDSIPEGAVVFISAPPAITNAVYGGLMSTRAKASGAAGTIIHGRIRDVREHRSLSYPVFACDVGTASPYESVKVVGVDVELELQTPAGPRVVRPGDWVVADIDGVVVIPQDKMERMVPLVGPQVRADEQMAEALKGGMPFMEASRKFRA